MKRCIVHPTSYTPTMCPEVPWKDIFEQPFCYTSEKDLAEWRELVSAWPPECRGIKYIVTIQSKFASKRERANTIEYDSAEEAQTYANSIHSENDPKVEEYP